MNSGVRGKVLCIEDNRDECELVKEILNEYDVTCVATIREAKRLLESDRFDLAIIDEHLPDGSGMSLCRHLTAERATTQCIIVSGDTFITENEAKEAGANALLLKSMINYVEELQWLVSRYDRSAHA
jgi:DNA-binding response OmpR family regulator